MFGFFGKNRKKQIEKKKEQEKNLDSQFQETNQQDIQHIQFQSKCQKAQEQLDNQFQVNQQQQAQKNAPNQIKNQQGQKLFPRIQYEGNLQQALNYHLIKMIFSYLNGVEQVQAKQSCQYFNFLIRFSSFKEEKHKEEKVTDNGITKYMEVDLFKIKDQNLIALKVVVSSKDQGWASASYSSSWVTLKLIKFGEDNLDHCSDSENLDEVLIVENYRVKQFKTHTIITTSFQNKNEKLTQLFNHIKGGNYDKLAIVMKCQYPGWECQIQYASVEFIILEKD